MTDEQMDAEKIDAGAPETCGSCEGRETCRALLGDRWQAWEACGYYPSRYRCNGAALTVRP